MKTHAASAQMVLLVVVDAGVDVDVAIEVELVETTEDVVVLCAAAGDAPHNASESPTMILRMLSVRPEASPVVNHSPAVDSAAWAGVSAGATGGSAAGSRTGRADTGRGAASACASAMRRLKQASRA